MLRGIKGELMKVMYVALGAFTGFILASFAFMAVAESQALRVHWTKREKYIQYRTHAIQLVRK